MVQAAAKRAEELRREINTHNHSYYVLDDSTISDAEYDCLLQHPGNRVPGPTDSLLADPTGGKRPCQWVHAGNAFRAHAQPK
jgi:hypothetical protein